MTYKCQWCREKINHKGFCIRCAKEIRTVKSGDTKTRDEIAKQRYVGKNLHSTKEGKYVSK